MFARGEIRAQTQSDGVYCDVDSLFIQSDMNII